MDLETFIMYLEKEMEQSRTRLDKKLGLVFYPCLSAIEEGLEKSMA